MFVIGMLFFFGKIDVNAVITISQIVITALPRMLRAVCYLLRRIGLGPVLLFRRMGVLLFRRMG